ncbi:MAG: hypothetical protein R6V72_15280 [Cyclobacterium sp.]|uniref:hypothetical protein n=1 Tax=Cyclobacterium sp. TaxID=1966343 RepID=UPI0039708170
MAGIQEDKLLKIRLFTHFSSMLPLIIVGILFLIVLVWIKFEHDAVIIFGVLFLADAIPALYLHFEYWLKNNGEEYEVQDARLIRRKNGEKIQIENGEIEKIVIYLSPSLYKNSNFHLLAIENYHFALIKLKSGEKFLLTSLLAPRIDIELKKMKGVLIERKKRLFCTLT